MSKIFITLIVIISIGGCAVYFKGPSYPNPLDTADYILILSDKEFSHSVMGAVITVNNDDSAQVHQMYSTYYLTNTSQDSLEITIEHQDFLPATIQLQRGKKVCQIDLQNRILLDDQPLWDTGAYHHGWLDAEKDLLANKACYYYSGGLRMSLLDVDTSTGLLMKGNFSCLVTPEQVQYGIGYNDKVTLNIIRNGLPVNSKKRWLGEIMEPKHFFKEQKRENKAITVQLNGSAIYSPDSVYSIKLVEMEERFQGWMKPVDSDSTSSNIQNRLVYNYDNCKKAEIVWGPEASELVIVKFKKTYYVFDLVSSQVINIE